MKSVLRKDVEDGRSGWDKIIMIKYYDEKYYFMIDLCMIIYGDMMLNLWLCYAVMI